MKRERWIVASDAIGSIEQEVWQPETPDERAEALRKTLYANAKPIGWGVLDDLTEIRELVDAGLVGLGWPPSYVRLAVTDSGKWRIIDSPNDLRSGETFKWSFLWIDKVAPPLSEAYWLGRISFALESARQHFERSDMRSFFLSAMRLGAYQIEIDVRRVALRYAETGKKNYQDSRRGTDILKAGSFKSLHGEAAQAMANRLLAEKPDRTWKKICELVAAEYGVSTETIRKKVENPKKRVKPRELPS